MKKLRARTKAAMKLLLKLCAVLVLLIGLGLAGLMRWPKLILDPINAQLQSSLTGELSIEQVEGWSPFGIWGIDARLKTADGIQVAHVQGATVELSLLDLAASLLGNGTKRRVVIDKVHVDHLDINLEQAADGSLLLAQALTPVPTPSPTSPKTELELQAAEFIVQHAWLHGNIPPQHAIDLELRNLDSSLAYKDDWLRLGSLVSKGTSRAPLAGPLQLNAAIALRFLDPPTLSAPIQDPLLGLESDSSAHLQIGTSRLKGKLKRDSRSTSGELHLELSSRHVETLAGPRFPHKNGETLLCDLAVDGTAKKAHVTARANWGSESFESSFELRQNSQRLELVGPTSLKNIQLAHLVPSEKAEISGNFNLQASIDQTSGWDTISRHQARIDGQLAPIDIKEQTLPATQFAIELDEEQLFVSARTQGENVEEPSEVSVRTQINDRLTVRAAQAEFSIDARWLDLVQPELLVSQGRITGRAHLSPDDHRIEAELSGALDSLVFADLASANQLRIRAQVEGPLSHPSQLRLKGAVSTPSATIAKKPFSRLQVEFEGPLSSAQISAFAQQDKKEVFIDGSLSLALGSEQAQFKSLRVRLLDDGEELGVQVNHMMQQGSGLKFSGLHTLSAPDAKLAGYISADNLALSGSLRRVRLGRMLEFLGLEEIPVHATIDLDADMRGSFGYLDGRVRLLARSVSWKVPHQQQSPVQISLDLIGEGSTLALVSQLRSQEQDDLPPQILAILRSPVPELHTLKQPNALWKSVSELELSGSFELEALRSFLPRYTSASGTLYLQGQLQRNSNSDAPLLQLKAHTQGLETTLPVGETVDKKPERIRIEGIEARLSGHYSPDSNDTDLRVSLTHQERLLLEAQVHVPRSPEQLFSLARRQWERLPFQARASIPSRTVSSWPNMIRPPQLQGAVAAQCQITGPITAPRGSLQVQFERLAKRAPDASHDAEQQHLSGTASVDFASHKTSWQLNARGESGLALESTGKLLTNWEFENLSLHPKQLEAKAKVRNFPVSTIDQAAAQSLAGTIDADLEISDWGTATRKLNANLALDHLTIDHLPLTGSRLALEADASHAALELHLEHENFRIKAKGSAGLVGQSDWIPRLDEQLNAAVEIDNFPLRLLRPFVGDQVAALAGQLDARAHFGTAAEKNQIHGKVSIRDGSFQVPQFGQRVENLHATLHWNKAGELKLTNGTFEGASGKGRIDLTGRMESWRPSQLNFRLRVGRNERLPLSLAGLGWGEFWGDVETKLALNWTRRKVDVVTQVREFQVRLPEIPSSQVQSLDAAPGVSVGTLLEGKGEWVEIPLQPIEEKASDGEPWKVSVDVDLGNKLWLQQGPTRRVQLVGNVHVNVADQVEPSGQIRIARGHVEINGRMFELREGRLTLREENPENPVLFAEARWTSPEGVQVIARFSGPVQDGTMSLSSEPALPDNQVLSLLLFGETSGIEDLGAAQSDAGSATQAAQVGGSVVSHGLNRVLSRVDAVDLSTRVSGSESGNVRPEVVIQLTNSLSAQLGYNLQEPAPGKSPDRTLLSLSLRLVGGHGLSATLGDRGTSLVDWVWRYRY